MGTSKRSKKITTVVWPRRTSKVQPEQRYLKGKSVFILSLLLMGLISLCVYLSDIEGLLTNSSRAYLTISLSGICLFIFLSWALYGGYGLVDNFPKLKKNGPDRFLAPMEVFVRSNTSGGEDGTLGTVLSIIFFLAFGGLFLAIGLMIFLLLCYLAFVILSLIYWPFYQALSIRLKQSQESRGNWDKSMMYALGSTLLYLGGGICLLWLTESLLLKL